MALIPCYGQYVLIHRQSSTMLIVLSDGITSPIASFPDLSSRSPSNGKHFFWRTDKDSFYFGFRSFMSGTAG